MSTADVFVVVLALAMGLAIAGLWTMLIATRQVPELRDHDRAIRFHIAAEYLLAAALLAAGAATISRASFATPLAAAAFGGLLYSSINSAGYYAKLGQRAFVAMFGVVDVLAVAGLVAVAR
jgi:hypothetical protein